MVLSGTPDSDKKLSRARYLYDFSLTKPSVSLSLIPNFQFSTTMSISMSSSLFKRGAIVEVRREEDDPANAAWYPATVLRRRSRNKDQQTYVEYKSLKSDLKKPLREHVHVDNIRPPPPPMPPEKVGQCFKVGYTVDVYHKKAWRRGMVKDRVEESKYLVTVNGGRKQIVVKQRRLRLNREWDNGFWVPPPREHFCQEQLQSQKTSSAVVKLKRKYSIKTSSPMFSLGTKVEVSIDEEGYGDSWFAATIIGSKGNDKFLVEYLTLKTEDNTKPLREEAYLQNIRPFPPELPNVDRFKRLEEVDAWYSDGWWVGVVSKILDGLKYIVYFSSTSEELVFEHSKLRPHQDWMDGKWITASKLEIREKWSELKVMAPGRGRKALAKFQTGSVVKVRSCLEGIEGSWFAAVIIGSVGEGKFLVEYEKLIADDEAERLKEIAHVSCIRHFPLAAGRFQFFEKVDAWVNNGWRVGRISKVLPCMKYEVYFWSTKEALEFDHSNLKHLDEWNEGKRVIDPKEEGKKVKLATTSCGRKKVERTEEKCKSYPKEN